MILLLLAAAIAPAPPLADLPGGDPARFAACTALIKADAARAIPAAELWAARGSGVPARQCLGLALAVAGHWTAAALAFDQAAAGAEAQGDGRAATLWSQAGNAALAAGDPTRARTYLDRALALPTLDDPMRGEAWLDRARADVSLNELAKARTDLDAGLKLVPADPFAWLLSATLARRQTDLARAEKDIAEAARLAPDDAGVALEAGNIAAASGVTEAATVAWQRAVQLAPGQPEGKAAAAALAAARP